MSQHAQDGNTVLSSNLKLITLPSWAIHKVFCIEFVNCYFHTKNLFNLNERDSFLQFFF